MLRRLALLGTLLLLPGSVFAAVAFDATANGLCFADVSCGAGHDTLTYAITVGAGSNRQIAVFTFIGCNSSDTPPNVTVTYAGQTLTQSTSVSATGRKGWLHVWPTGSQPTSGTNNVVVTAASNVLTTCSGTGSPSIESGAISATGVDQSTTFTSTNTNSGSGTSATVNISSSGANDMGVHAACSGTSMTSTTETERWNVDNGENACASHGGATAAAGDTSFSWTIGSDSWAMIGAALKAAGAGGPDVTPFYRRRVQ